MQCLQAPLEGRADGARGGGDQPLHEDHEEAHVTPLLAHGLVIAIANVVGDRLVQVLLFRVARLPAHRYELRPAWLEEWGPLRVDRAALLVPDNKRQNPLAVD